MKVELNSRKAIDEQNQTALEHPKLMEMRKAFDAGKTALKERDMGALSFPPYDVATQPELWQAFVWGAHKEATYLMLMEAEMIIVGLISEM